MGYKQGAALTDARTGPVLGVRRENIWLRSLSWQEPPKKKFICHRAGSRARVG